MGAVGQPPPQTVYEADAPGNSLSGTAAIQACPGYTGSSCLDGYNVGGIGSGAENSITLQNIQAPSSGTYNLLVYAGTTQAEIYQFSINGEAPIKRTLVGTEPGVPIAMGLQVQLNAGMNSIEFSNPNQPAPDLDHILISGPITTAEGFDFVYPEPSSSISSAGQSGSAIISLVPVGGFSGSVQVSCALPAAMVGASCSPVSVNLTGTSSTDATIVITTTGSSSTASLNLHRVGESEALRIETGRRSRAGVGSAGQTITTLLGFTLPLPALGFWIARRRRSSAASSFLAILCLLGVSFVGTELTACGPGGQKQPIVKTCSSVPAAPIDLAASATGDSSTTLSWRPGTVTANCALTKYSVYENGILIGTTTETNYAIKGLTPSTKYAFTVTASDVAGSSETADLSVQTLAPPQPTPAGTYSVSIMASSTSVTKTTNIQVVVQ